MNLRSISIATAKKFSRIMWNLTGRKQFIGKSIPVLSYHRVLPGFIENDKPMYSVLPEQFTEQLQYLSEHGFVSLSLEEYEQITKGEKDIPECAVLVTFDDGYADFYSQALPIAQRFGIKLNIFVCTGLVAGTNHPIYPEVPAHAREHEAAFPELWRALNWNEVRQMRAAGVGVGFHGHSHRKMAHLTLEEVALEFEQGLSLYAQETNHQLTHFAYPHGSFDSYNDERIKLVARLGMKLQFSTRLRRTLVDAKESLISRIVIHQEDDLETFKLKLFGAYEWLGAVRYWNQRRKAPALTQENQSRLSQRPGNQLRENK